MSHVALVEAVHRNKSLCKRHGGPSLTSARLETKEVSSQYEQVVGRGCVDSVICIVLF